MSETIMLSERIVASLNFNNFFSGDKFIYEVHSGYVAEDIEFSDYFHRLITKRVSDGALFASPWGGR